MTDYTPPHIQNGPVEILKASEAQVVTFAARDGGRIEINMKNGKITITGMTLDAAAEDFWRGVERAWNVKRPCDEEVK